MLAIQTTPEIVFGRRITKIKNNAGWNKNLTTKGLFPVPLFHMIQYYLYFVVCISKYQGSFSPSCGTLINKNRSKLETILTLDDPSVWSLFYVLPKKFTSALHIQLKTSFKGCSDDLKWI